MTTETESYMALSTVKLNLHTAIRPSCDYVKELWRKKKLVI